MKRIAAAVLLIAVFVTLGACSKTEAAPIQAENIRAICNLATLKCYYNNVAKYEKPAQNIFQKDRKMWIEYESEATLGIDMNDTDIQIVGTTVTIKMLDAKVLLTDYTLEKESIVASKDGWWIFSNQITQEEAQAAINAAQKEMEETICKDTALLDRAKERAKILIENYINTLAAAAGEEYTIVWVD